MRSLRIGCLGGTFDPPHFGHLAAAKAVFYEYELHKMLMIPAGAPPHKHGQTVTDSSVRLEMTRLAVGGLQGFEVSDIELMREGKSYTVDTLREIGSLHPGAKIFFIIGADMLLYLRKWKDLADLLKLAVFVVVNRPGCDSAAVVSEIDAINAEYGSGIRLLTVQGVDLSSTALRAAAAEGSPLDFLVPDAVSEYIHKNGVYGMFNKIEKEAREKYSYIADELKRTLSPKRFNHTLGTVYAAVRLAGLYGAEREKCFLSALVHDCAKCYTIDELDELAEKYGENTSSLEGSELKHAPVGALLAEHSFGIKDREVLDAVRHHTLGKAGMNIYEKILFVADSTEPTRGEHAEALRVVASENIDKAVLFCLRSKLSFARARGKQINEASYKTMEYYGNILP